LAFTYGFIFKKNGHRDVVLFLIEHGANINSQNDDNDTPLHLALTTRGIDVIYLLLRQRCNVFLKGFQDKDCIKTADECGLHDLAEYMRKYGQCMKVNSCPNF
jgi:ankyrin repeat protein